MITKKMIKEFTVFCEENEIKTASIGVHAPNSRISYHGYIYGNCITGISCHGATFDKFNEAVNNNVKTKQSRIADLKQQLSELEA